MKVRKKILEQNRIELTPLIDILFLLIIFFLTSSSLTKNNAYRVDLPEAETQDELTEDLPILTIKEDDKIFLQEREVLLENLESVLMQEVVEKKIVHLVIAGDENIAYQKIIDIMSISKKVGIEQVSLKVDNLEK